MKTMFLLAMFLALPVQVEETDPEKEGHVHEDEAERRKDHSDDTAACKSWGYCFPSGHDPVMWREYLPEGTVLHACPKMSRCHPEKEGHDKQYCGDVNGEGVRSHCDQACREQCCFCCGSP